MEKPTDHCKRAGDSCEETAGSAKRAAVERVVSFNAIGSGGSATNIDALPAEMLCRILSFITLPELLRMARVSHRWRQAVGGCLAHCSMAGHSFGLFDNAKLERILSRLPGLYNLTQVVGKDLDVDIISRHCPQLVNAGLYTFRLDLPSLERLCRSCPKLKSLCLPEPNIDDACVEAVLRGLPRLHSLYLDISELTGRCLSLLPDSLRRLGLAGDWNLNPDELKRAARCPALVELDIASLSEPEYSPSGELTKLLSFWPQLERLDADSSDITDAFLEKLPELAPSLRDLNLASCGHVSCEGLKSLGRLKELRTLNLFETYTDDDVLNELQGAAHLTELSVGTFPHNGPKFTIEALARLVVSCPSLRVVRTTIMVDSTDLADSLIGRLGPERDVTLEMDDEECVQEVEELLPKDGPLRVAYGYR